MVHFLYVACGDFLWMIGMDEIKYPEEIKVEAAIAQMSRLLQAKMNILRVLYLIRAESEKGRIYGHFC